MVSVYKSVTGIFVENTYFLVNKKEKWGIIVDPGQHALQFLERLHFKDISWKAIFLTHAHFDHLLGLSEIVERFHPKIYLHKDDLFIYRKFKRKSAKFGYVKTDLPTPDYFWKDGDKIHIGTTVFEIIHTPGHTPGSVCIRWDKKLLTGDTLMYHSFGKTETFSSLEQNKKSVFQKLFTLPSDTIIYPGHQKSSSIEEEVQYNSQNSLK